MTALDPREPQAESPPSGMPARPAAPVPPGRRMPVKAPPGHWLWGHGPEIIENPLVALPRLASLGDVVELRFSWIRAALISAPDLIQQIFQDHRTFNKQTLTYQRLHVLVGDGLVRSDGEFWLRQRRIAQPAFHRQRIAGFASVMIEAAMGLVERLAAFAQSGEPLDLAQEMTQLTLAVVCETLLGGDVGTARQEVSAAFSVLNHLSMERAQARLALPLWVPTASNRRFRTHLQALDQTVYEIITRRRGANEEAGDLLSMLLQARDPETGEGMSDLQLRDEVATMLLAGHETTAVTLSWALYLLSQHPEVEARLREELRTVLQGRPPTYEDLDRLEYPRMVVDETLRLYPPVWGLNRHVAEDTELGGYHLPRGMIVLVSPWVTHRSAAIWQAPEAFRPERFAAGRKEALPRYAYFPFIGGARQCIGNHFALMEAQLVLAALYQRYHFALWPGHPVEPEPVLTLRPKHGMKMRIELA
jgi:cytochrome P450